MSQILHDVNSTSDDQDTLDSNIQCLSESTFATDPSSVQDIRRNLQMTPLSGGPYLNCSDPSVIISCYDDKNEPDNVSMWASAEWPKGMSPWDNEYLRLLNHELSQASQTHLLNKSLWITSQNGSAKDTMERVLQTVVRSYAARLAFEGGYIFPHSMLQLVTKDLTLPQSVSGGQPITQTSADFAACSISTEPVSQPLSSARSPEAKLIIFPKRNTEFPCLIDVTVGCEGLREAEDVSACAELEGARSYLEKCLRIQTAAWKAEKDRQSSYPYLGEGGPASVDVEESLLACAREDLPHLPPMSGFSRISVTVQPLSNTGSSNGSAAPQ